MDNDNLTGFLLILFVAGTVIWYVVKIISCIIKGDWGAFIGWAIVFPVFLFIIYLIASDNNMI